jgi:anaerobic selenocysteine-containing dehydrogenase
MKSLIDQTEPPPREPDGVETRDSVVDIWGPRTPYNATIGRPWPTRVDQHTSCEPDKWVQSACVMCSNGCGLDIGVKDGRIVGVRGREVDRSAALGVCVQSSQTNDRPLAGSIKVGLDQRDFILG